MHADDSFDRGERPFEYGYFHSTGGSRVTVPTGRVDVEVSRGPEYRVERRSLQIKPGAVDPGSHRARRGWRTCRPTAGTAETFTST